MRTNMLLRRALGATIMTALAVSLPGPAISQIAKSRGVPAKVSRLPAGSHRPTTEVQLSVGQGELINLPANVSDVWTSNPGVADVYVSNPRQIHLFGKDFGEATVFATAANGAVVYATNVRVGQNITSVDRMIAAALPEADIRVTTVGQLAVLNGTVASPEDSAQAERLVASLLNPGVDTSAPNATLKMGVVNRLKMASPLQVNLQVRIAEVSRSFVKNIGVNLASADSTGGFKFGVARGRSSASQFVPGGPIGVGTSGSEGVTVLTAPTTGTALYGAGRLLGLDLLGSLDLGERNGQVTTLANPNLTALSGETGTFLAGGEVPIPISQGLGAVSVEYKQYGVSLAYTPTVLSDGRISLRVRPEVSQLTDVGAVTLNGTQIPALTTRRAETTVELGSGQSFMIAGLIQNRHDNFIDKAPGIGDLPVLGALFRSNGFQRNETELVIVITPYLVRPVNASQIALPTDGYRAPTDGGRILLGELQSGVTGEQRPMPSMAPPADAQPAIGAVAPLPSGPTLPDAAADKAVAPRGKQKSGASAAPGFSTN